MSSGKNYEQRHKGQQPEVATHSLVDVFRGASKLLLHPLLKEVDAEL